jgi:septum site-determining protein MinD
MGVAIVVASGKGGTGKTSLSAGVGSALALHGKKTLCLDCDVGLRNLDIALGMTSLTSMDFSDVVFGRCALEDAAAEHPRIKGLFLLTAPSELGESAIPTDGMSGLVDEIKRKFDYCIVDAPAGLGAGFRLASCGADRAIIVTTTDPSALRDAQHAVMELQNYRLKSVHLVVNRVQQKMLRKLHRSIDDAMDEAGLPLIGVVPEDRNVQLAAADDVPLILFDRGGAARAYENIAYRICGEKRPLMKIR